MICNCSSSMIPKGVNWFQILQNNSKRKCSIFKASYDSLRTILCSMCTVLLLRWCFSHHYCTLIAIEEQLTFSQAISDRLENMISVIPMKPILYAAGRQETFDHTPSQLNGGRLAFSLACLLGDCFPPSLGLTQDAWAGLRPWGWLWTSPVFM